MHFPISAWLIVLIGTFLINSVPTRGLAETNVENCYGETLEVQMHVFAPDRKDGGQVILSLPNPASWTLIGWDGGGSLRDAECQKEPVRIREAYSSNLQHKFTVALSKGDAPVALKDVISLSLAGSLKDAPNKSFYSEYFENENWSPIPHGFGRLDSIGDELVMTRHNRSFTVGTIRFPNEYQTPLGQPMVVDCSRFGFCNAGYFLHERFRVKYRFSSSLEYNEKWIPQDLALRVLIDSWITDLPILKED